MKLLILGSTGTLGTGIEEVCKEKSIAYVSLTHKDFEITDFKDSDIIRYDCNIIVNCVALMGINPCEEDPNKTFAINSTPTYRLAGICQKNDLILVYPSSHGVFDGKINPCTEETPINPKNTYSISKYVAECFARRCENHYVLRLPILFGKKRNTPVGFIDKIPYWLREGKTLKMATDKHDSVAYNKDVAHLLLEIIEKRMPNGTYHLANEGIPSYYEIACKMRDFYGFDNEILKSLDANFPSKGPKSLETHLCSIKLNPMRRWDVALKEFIQRDGGHFKY